MMITMELNEVKKFQEKNYFKVHVSSLKHIFYISFLFFFFNEFGALLAIFFADNSLPCFCYLHSLANGQHATPKNEKYDTIFTHLNMNIYSRKENFLHILFFIVDLELLFYNFGFEPNGLTLF